MTLLIHKLHAPLKVACNKLVFHIALSEENFNLCKTLAIEKATNLIAQILLACTQPTAKPQHTVLALHC